jgi:hypothetical protein
MWNIYFRAMSVLVFLGSGPDCSALFDLFDLIEVSNGESPSNKPINNLIMSEFVRVLDVDWWERIWVIQEFAFALRPPLIGYNHRWTDATVFFRAFEFLMERLEADVLLFDNYLQSESPTALRHTSSLSEMLNPQRQSTALDTKSLLENLNLIRARYSILLWRLRARPETFRMSDLVMDSIEHKATDSRDKVFALQSLMMEPIRTCFTPDYTRSVANAYTRTATYLMCVEQWRNMYNFLPICTIDNLPSWVPDFSKSDTHGKYSNTRRMRSSQYLGKVATLECSVVTGILRIRLIDCGTVNSISTRRIIRETLKSKFSEFDPVALESERRLYQKISQHYSDSDPLFFITLKEVRELIASSPIIRLQLLSHLSTTTLHDHLDDATMNSFGTLLKLLRSNDMTIQRTEWLNNKIAIRERICKELDFRLGKHVHKVEDIKEDLRDEIRSNQARRDKVNGFWGEFEDVVRKVASESENPVHELQEREVLFSTDRDVMGIGPQGLCRVDKFVVFCGMNAAFIARPCEEAEGDLWVLIGKVRLLGDMSDAIEKGMNDGSLQQTWMSFR